MDLERVSVVLRPRSSWEAMDLGLALLNANRRVVWTTFGICVMPIYAAVWLTFYRWPPIAFFLLWWLKPLFDRVPLAILSEALFGGDVSVKAAMRALRRSVRPFLLRSLTVSRLSPIRSFLLPIWQLEGHKGTSVLRRERVLGGATLGPAASLMAVCAGLEQCFMLSGLSFIFMFMPENLEMDAVGVFESMSDGLTPLWFSVAFGIVHALAVAFVEPVYVAAGFGLYVNRRMSLEGWDVELGFRRMVKRLGPTLLALFALSLAAPRAWATDDTGAPQQVSVEAQEAAVEAQRAAAAEAQRRAGPPVERDAVAAEVAEILARPEFPHTETRFDWKLPQAESKGWNFNLPFGPFIAVIVKALALIALAVGLTLLVRALLRFKRGRTEKTEDEEIDEQRRLPAMLREIGALPEDVGVTAWRWWTEGRHAAALGLLYSAALLDLVKLRGLSLAEGDTESECLSAARPSLPGDSWSYFSALTVAWQGAAYAHRLPEEPAAKALCDAWRAHFRRAP